MAAVTDNLLYVELKSGFSDDGPAWIGRGTWSKSGRTLYFNDRAFQSLGGSGASANYFDLESKDQYWISGIKKDQQERHWAGSGKISIDAEVVEAYLAVVRKSELDPVRFEVVQLSQGDVRERILRLENEPL